MEADMVIKDTSGRFWGAIGVMLGFGIVYNQLIAFLQRQGYSQGYTAVLVVAGTAITLVAAVPVIGIRAALYVAGLFAASGLPMTLGSMQRYAAARRDFEMWRRANKS